MMTYSTLLAAHGRCAPYWRLLLLWLLGLGALRGAQAQPTTPFAVRITPPGPLRLAAGTTEALYATAFTPAFEVGSGFDGPVAALAVQPDGKVVAVGSLGGLGGYNAQQRALVARLNPDGSLDAGFAAKLDFSGTATSLAVQTDGKVLVGGRFTRAAGAAAYNIFRLNADGSLDESFPRVVAGLDAGITKLLVQPDNKILVSGSYALIPNTGIFRNTLVRLNADGSLDGSFTGASAGRVGSVNALAVQADGKLLAGGTFSNESAFQRRFLSRLNANGGTDPAFGPVGGFDGLNGAVAALAVQPADQRILVGGSFTAYGTTPRNAIARFTTTGELDSGFAPAGTGFNGPVATLALQADGKVLVGGDFTSYNGRDCAYIARLTSTGQLDPSFAQNGFGGGLNGRVAALAVQPADASVLVGGSFTAYGFTPDRYIARLNADGSLNTRETLVYATYTWNTGNVDPRLLVTAAGTYSATATINGVSVASGNAVQVELVTPGSYHLNAGYSTAATSRGQFTGDQSYSAASRAFNTSAPIAGTLDPILYQSERFSTHGALSYRLPILNGTYKVVLYFAEIYWTRVGQRVFDVSLEGRKVLTNYDIVKKVGPLTATSETFFATVTDGVLDLDLRVPYESGGADQAKISAIEVVSTSPVPRPGNQRPVATAGPNQAVTLAPSQPTTSVTLQGSGTDTDGSTIDYTWTQLQGPAAAFFSSTAEAVPLVSQLVAGTYVFGLVVADSDGAASAVSQVTITVSPSPYVPVFRLNAGGLAQATTRGDFSADKYPDLNSGRFTTTAAISTTPDPGLYQSERFSTHGALAYSFDVGNGDYVVILHFAEIYWTQPGQRVFDVQLENTKVLTNYDIVKEVGPFTATTKTFAVAVTDGVLNLDLRVPYGSGGADQAKISAIEVLKKTSLAGRNSQPLLATAVPSTLRELLVYPNPSAGRFTITCAASQAQEATLTLTDQLGRTVYQQAAPMHAGANQVVVEAPNLGQGLYQLSLRLADGQRQSQRLLIRP